MLKFLKSNSPLVGVLSPFLALIFLSPVFFDEIELNELQIQIIDFLWVWELNDALFYLLMTLLITVTSICCNIFYNKAEFFKTQSSLPGVFYSILAGILIKHFGFHIILLSTVFLIISLAILFSVHKQKRALSQYFISGIFLGLSILFYPPWVFLLVFFIISAASLGTFNWRRVVVLVLGLMLPLLYLAVSHYLLDWPMSISFLNEIEHSTTWSLIPLPLKVCLGFVFILLLVSFKEFTTSYSRGSIRSRSSNNNLLINSLGIIISLGIGSFFIHTNLLYGIIGLISIFLTFSLSSERTTRLVKVVFYLTLLSCVITLWVW